MKKKDVQNLLKIDSGTTIRFDNAHHAEFHRQQYEDVLAVAPAKLKLPAGLLEEWKKNIDLEVAINKESDKDRYDAIVDSRFTDIALCIGGQPIDGKLDGLDYKAGAEKYLLDAGMTEEEIAQLENKLCGK